ANNPQAPIRIGRQSRRQRWTRRRIALIGIPLVAVVLLAVFALPLLLNANNAYQDIFVSRLHRGKVVLNAQGTPVIDPNANGATLPDWGKKERINLLLLGVDSNPARLAEGDPPLSDTMIIVSIDPLTKQVGMLSIPRDLLVMIPGLGEEKINAAYSNGSMSDITGPGLVQATVEYNFGIPIHYYAEVELQGFEKIIDTIGGVTIDVAAPIKDDVHPGEGFNTTRVYFPAGLQHMDGATALRFSRTRHDDNDFARGNRQQQMLMTLREQAIQLNLITKANQLLQDLGGTVRTDLSPTETLQLAKLGTEIKGSDIHSYSLRSATSEQNDARGYYLIPDWTAIRGIVGQMIPNASASPFPARSTSSSPSPRGDLPIQVAEQPDLQARVLVQNATNIDGLAGNTAGKLQQGGFPNVSAEQSPETGSHPTSLIINYTASDATARQVSELLGIPATSIQKGDPSLTGEHDLVVVMGDDSQPPDGMESQ
ncbi:LCP family protein, partial [Nitrolancea hollandica]|uniref:LCP family protein n=1 Tax=Nitrolancea hollandica TaxID=1206749 RepID=UPI00058B3F6A